MDPKNCKALSDQDELDIHVFLFKQIILPGDFLQM